MSGDADHKNIAVLGEAGVGKTCFTDTFLTGRPFHQYNPTNPWILRKTVQVGEKALKMTLDDINSSLYREPTAFHIALFNKILRDADGIVLLYDVTSRASFDYITKDGYWNVIRARKPETDDGVPYLCRAQRFGCVLVGSKADTPAEKKEVHTELAQQWADSQGIRSHEVNTSDIVLITAAMQDLGRSIIRAERYDAEEVQETMKSMNAKKKRPSTFMNNLRQAFR